MKNHVRVKGFTLLEAVITTAILSIIGLSLVGMLTKFGAAVSQSRTISLATHLAQEQIESVRSQTFYAIMVTSATSHTLSQFAGLPKFDPSYYPPEDIVIEGQTYTRYTFVEKTDTPTGEIQNMGYPHPDTGLKRINVHTVWQTSDGVWKKVSVSGLASNPNREQLDKRIWGYVTDADTTNPVAGALVQARRNPGWGSYTDDTGYYSFQATDATMKMVSNRYGYSQTTTPKFNIDYGDNRYDLTMQVLQSTTVTGHVVIYSSVIISGVNLDYDGMGGNYFIELYNGSTNTVDMSSLAFDYYLVTGASEPITSLVVSCTTVNPNSYYLVWGGGGGPPATPDATMAHPTWNRLAEGGIRLWLDGEIRDTVGWGNPVNPAPTETVETDFFDTTPNATPGIPAVQTIVRKALSTSTAVSMDLGGDNRDDGSAWDSQDNSNDFVLIPIASPRNTLITNVAQGGTTIEGALLSGGDTFSTSTKTATNGYFEFDMAEGTYTITAASGTVMAEQDIYVSTIIPNYHLLFATNPATVGYVYGDIRRYCSTSKFANIVVQADPGAYQTVSDGNGEYWMSLPANEEYYLTGNPEFINADWNTAVTPESIYISPGLVHGPYELCIWKNSYVSGRITTNGVDGVPGMSVIASGQFSNGNSAVTDAAGYYIIPGLRLIGNPYVVQPVLLPGQAATPGSITVTLTQGNNLTNQDFLIDNSYVTVSGTATYNGVPIKSGVTVLITTNTINADSPPDITFAMRREGTSYYQTLTNSNGLYTVPVIGGVTYNLTAWYTLDNGSTTAKAKTVVVATNEASVGNNLDWP